SCCGVNPGGCRPNACRAASVAIPGCRSRPSIDPESCCCTCASGDSGGRCGTNRLPVGSTEPPNVGDGPTICTPICAACPARIPAIWGSPGVLCGTCEPP